MMTIWKFGVLISSKVDTCIDMPAGSRIVHVGTQEDNMMAFWAMVDKDHPLRRRVFKAVGTSHEFATDWHHVGSVIVTPFAWHLLEWRPALEKDRDMIDTKPCPKCTAKMIQRNTGAILLTCPAQYPWEWRCGCGHREKGGALRGITSEQQFQNDWKAAQ